MSDRCAESTYMRRGSLSLRCDRKAGHQTDSDVTAKWHFDMSHDAWWQWDVFPFDEHYLTVVYALEESK